MNNENSNSFLKDRPIKIKFKQSIYPLTSAMKGANIDRYKSLSMSNRNKNLNLELIAKSDEFNSIYITAVYDKEIDKIVIFYNIYRKYFSDHSSYREVPADENWFNKIGSLLKENEADPEVVKEKIIFK